MSTEGRVVKEGWLLKKRRKKMQGFARRYFVLYQSGHLEYSFEPGKPVRDHVSLNHAAISSIRALKDIHIDSSNATFHMKCLSVEDFDEWMNAFRQFIAPPSDTKTVGRKSSLGRVTPRMGHPCKAGFMVEEMGATIAELESAVNAWYQADTKKRVPSASKSKGDKEKQETHKFGLFGKKATLPHHDGAPRDSADSRLSMQAAPHERVQAALSRLKTQQQALAKVLPALPLAEGSPASALGSPAMPAFAEAAEEIYGSRTPASRHNRTSVATSLSDGGSVWFDATDGSAEGAEEFLIDITPPAEVSTDSKISTVTDSHSDIYHDSDASDTDEEEQEVKESLELMKTDSREVVRRTQLPSGPVGDEGSLFAVFKKNVGKDLSNIAFPVSFNEPLTLLQREAEVVEYYNLLDEAAQTQDPVERLCYVAAFAVSGYAHTKYRSSRKGFNPMLAETFEEPRVRFIAEKVSHHPVILACHAEGEGWEVWATSSGKTKFWVITLRMLTVLSYRCIRRKPSTFMRNLMMGTKYLEHTGKMTVENVTTRAKCVIEFKENGYWAVANDVFGTVYSPSGKIEAHIEGKWDDSLVRRLNHSHLQVLWRMTPFPKNSPEYYGFTSWAMTLNEITEDLVGKLPPTDSRYRPDVRALEEGDIDRAEAEKMRVEELQRERRAHHRNAKPRWFKPDGNDWPEALTTSPQSAQRKSRNVLSLRNASCPFEASADHVALLKTEVETIVMRPSELFGVLGACIGLVVAQQGEYQQCGGIGWTGATKCVSGWTCQEQNDLFTSVFDVRELFAVIFCSFFDEFSASCSDQHGTSQYIPRVESGAQAAVTKLSLQDKVNLGTGVQWMKAIPSINFPGLCLEDSPLGVRYADFVSAFPPGINTAATFNRTLMRQRGEALGAEFRGKGVHVALGPDMRANQPHLLFAFADIIPHRNMMRAPAAGRNWEGFGGDPYLSGEGAYETITGIQSQGVQASAKHYINNEQEHSRDSSSSNVDDRTVTYPLSNSLHILMWKVQQHEIYGHPFLRSVQANVASVMCSYNQINGSFSCENDQTLNGLLKGEFAFQGYVTSDWWATHSTAPAVNNGLDMTMPGDTADGSGVSYFGPALVSAVQSGAVPESRITDMATRILAAWYLLGQDSGFPAVNFDAWNLNAPVNTHVNVQADHASLIRTIGAASTVLLKNVNNALPLKAPKTIGIVGNGAGPSSRGPNGYTDRGGDDGVLAMGWGSGTDDFPYLITPLDAITNRSKSDGTTVSSSLSDSDLNAAASTASGKDVAFVFITADSGEGYITVEGNAGDRNDLSAWHNGNALVESVASANKNTIVVVNSVGPIIVEDWIDHPNVIALRVEGNSLVDVLYGVYNPSGRLPYTIGKATTDYAAQVIYTSDENPVILPIPYSEGIFIDYKHFDQAGIAPRYEFGFGLSYTTFQYSGLNIKGTVGTGTPPSGPGSSLDPVSFSLKNNGTVAGHESPQLYTSPPASAKAAPFNLRGFDNVFLAPGESQTVSFNLSRYDLSSWSVTNQRWEVPSGSTGVSMGASSRDLRLQGTIQN
ncbi:hypothetical protein EWM64_g1318 [Hericium alpestre]|uniref:beta-glucosidase n=1 Tax=Hericium alpestre TaxID=135208 RepID=A0A4Z0A6N5_9AGAM|nr:hypothetical protein EWM64_g1318 [Hericium alpestre]